MAKESERGKKKFNFILLPILQADKDENIFPFKKKETMFDAVGPLIPNSVQPSFSQQKKRSGVPPPLAAEPDSKEQRAAGRSNFKQLQF